MREELVLAIDIGTHAVRSALLNVQGKIVCVAEREVGLSRLDHARVEQDPQALLLACRETMSDVLHNNDAVVSSAGIAVQRSSVIAWSKQNGQALSPVLSWQDTRGREALTDLHQYETEIQQRSGLVLSPHYGATKLALLQQALGNPKNEALCLSPLISFLLFHLVDGNPCLCDESNAGRTQLWNIQARCWDEYLLAKFGVDVNFLPLVQPTCSSYGVLQGTNVSLMTVCGDQNAALNAVLKQGDNRYALANLGSGGFVLGQISKETLVTTSKQTRLLIGHARTSAEELSLLLEGTVNGCGTAFSWFVKLLSQSRQRFSVDGLDLGGDHKAIERQMFELLPNWLLAYQPSVIFVNTIGGLGSPWWQANIEPAFVDIKTGKVLGHLPQNEDELKCKVIAILESIAFLIHYNIREIAAVSPELCSIYVSGGLSRSEALCQMLADVSGMVIARFEQHEMTVVGVARLVLGEQYSGEFTVRDYFKPQDNLALKQRCNMLEKQLMLRCSEANMPRT